MGSVVGRLADAPLSTPQPRPIGRALGLVCAVWTGEPYQAARAAVERVGVAVGLLQPTRRFVLFASARSGSTLLASALDRHRHMECAGEVLNHRYQVYGDLRGRGPERLARHVRALLPAAGPAAAGVKVLTEQLDLHGWPADRLLASVGDPPVLVLYRRSLLESYVSLKIAFKNDVWYSSVANSESVEVDRDAFLVWADRERGRWRRLLSSLDGRRVLVLEYADVADNLAATVGRIEAFLGCPPDPGLARPASVRQNPQPLEEKVANYAGCGLGPMHRAGRLDLHVVQTGARVWLETF